MAVIKQLEIISITKNEPLLVFCILISIFLSIFACAPFARPEPGRRIAGPSEASNTTFPSYRACRRPYRPYQPGALGAYRLSFPVCR